MMSSDSLSGLKVDEGDSSMFGVPNLIYSGQNTVVRGFLLLASGTFFDEGCSLLYGFVKVFLPSCSPGLLLDSDSSKIAEGSLKVLGRPRCHPLYPHPTSCVCSPVLRLYCRGPRYTIWLQWWVPLCLWCWIYFVGYIVFQCFGANKVTFIRFDSSVR